MNLGGVPRGFLIAIFNYIGNQSQTSDNTSSVVSIESTTLQCIHVACCQHVNRVV